MRERLLKLLTLVTIVFMCAVSSPAVLSAQTVDFSSTPEPTTRERGEGTAFPQFGIVAVGDHPRGFFDDLEVAPGASIELTAAIVNTGTIPVSLRTFKVNALSGPNGGFLAGEEEDEPFGATQWIDYTPFELELAPEEQYPVTFTVTVPADASPGQYISGIAAVTTDTIPIQGTELLNQSRGYVISVGIVVPGGVNHAFEVGTPDTANRVLQIPVTNTGNYLVRPMGEVTLSDANGNQVHHSAITMGSVYAGLTSPIVISLPEQMAAGNYVVDVSLIDPASGVTDEVADAAVAVAEPADPTGISATVDIEPNAEPIAFANVTVSIANGGGQIGAATVYLVVMKDGELLEEFPLAANQPLPTGETEVTGRYIPADAWGSGEYTFQVEITSTSRQGTGETILLTVDASDTIVVP